MLLVVDVPAWDNKVFVKALRALIANGRTHELPLYVMAFVDRGLGELEADIRELWRGPVNIVAVSTYLDRVASEVRQYACSFAADLRERLEAVAAAVGGRTWAKRFGEFWWYTELSEKNSTAVPPWWELLRLEAIRARLEECGHSECVYLGTEAMIEPLHQFCNRLGTRLTAKAVQRYRASLVWLLLLRGASFLFLTSANILARLVQCQDLRGQDFSMGKEGKTFVFTYFPRSWTEVPEWTDRYYGRLFNGTDKHESGRILILTLLDHLNQITFRMAWARYQLLRRGGLAPWRYLVLEAYTSIPEIFRLHFSVKDIWQYLRMRRCPEFREGFCWHGLDVSGLAEPRVVRSLVFDWPHLQLVERCAERVSRIGSPVASWLYLFEYAPGRAVIRGLKAGGRGKVFGLQHGPITPMKFTYAADMRDRQLSPCGGPPVPEPDFYITEGSLAGRILEESSVSPDRIVIVGAPRMERIWERARKSQARRRFAADPVRVLLGLGLHDFRFILGLVWEALANNPTLRIVIKPHPKTPMDALPPWVEVAGGAEVAYVESNTDIYTLMEDADLLIGTYSSVVVEAPAFGLPVVLLKSNRVPDLSPFFSHPSLVLSASDGSTLRTHVNTLIRDSTFRDNYLCRLQSLVSDVFAQMDGGAAERVSTLYHELGVGTREDRIS